MKSSNSLWVGAALISISGLAVAAGPVGAKVSGVVQGVPQANSAPASTAVPAALAASGPAAVAPATAASTPAEIGASPLVRAEIARQMESLEHASALQREIAGLKLEIEVAKLRAELAKTQGASIANIPAAPVSQMPSSPPANPVVELKEVVRFDGATRASFSSSDLGDVDDVHEGQIFWGRYVYRYDAGTGELVLLDQGGKREVRRFTP